MIKQLAILLGLVAVCSSLSCNVGNVDHTKDYDASDAIGTLTETDCAGVTIGAAAQGKDPNNSGNNIAHCSYPKFADYTGKFANLDAACGKCAAGTEATCVDCTEANCNDAAKMKSQVKVFECYKFEWKDSKWQQKSDKKTCKASKIRCFIPGKGADTSAKFDKYKDGCADDNSCAVLKKDMKDTTVCGTCDKTKCNGAASVVFSSVLAIAAFILHFA